MSKFSKPESTSVPRSITHVAPMISDLYFSKNVKNEKKKFKEIRVKILSLLLMVG